MSSRVMETLRNFGFEMEVYSIDECFITFPSYLSAEDLRAIATQMKNRVYRWTGIPVSVGIGKTKTLAKIANEHAKTHNGVCILHNPDQTTALLRETPVGDVWGIGRGISDRLGAMGVTTAAQFRSLDNRQVRQQFNVTLQRTHYELDGISCLPLEDIQPRKNICSSRAFSRHVHLQAVELSEPGLQQPIFDLRDRRLGGTRFLSANKKWLALSVLTFEICLATSWPTIRMNCVR